MSLAWNTSPKLVAVATLVAAMALPSVALAQRGRGAGPRDGGGGRGPGGRVVVAPRPVVVGPYYSPFYSPFYDPVFFNWYGWGFPSFYAPAFYGRGSLPESSARIQVKPRDTEVYVDGYLAGIVDDFDGFAQRLKVSPGEHAIDLYLDGHKTISQKIFFQAGETYRIRHTMEPLAPGEAPPARPQPDPNAPARQAPAPFDAFGRGAMPPPAANASSTIAIRVQPGDAVVLIDGERWQTSGGDRLDVQVTPGEHRIEIQKDGYQPFSTTVRVRPGDTSPINVSLTKSGEE